MTLQPSIDDRDSRGICARPSRVTSWPDGARSFPRRASPLRRWNSGWNESPAKPILSRFPCGFMRSIRAPHRRERRFHPQYANSTITSSRGLWLGLNGVVVESPSGTGARFRVTKWTGDPVGDPFRPLRRSRVFQDCQPKGLSGSTPTPLFRLEAAFGWILSTMRARDSPSGRTRGKAMPSPNRICGSTWRTSVPISGAGAWLIQNSGPSTSGKSNCGSIFYTPEMR